MRADDVGIARPIDGNGRHTRRRRGALLLRLAGGARTAACLRRLVGPFRLEQAHGRVAVLLRRSRSRRRHHRLGLRRTRPLLLLRHAVLSVSSFTSRSRCALTKSSSASRDVYAGREAEDLPGDLPVGHAEEAQVLEERRRGLDELRDPADRA